jgi:hypothetical protein
VREGGLLRTNQQQRQQQRKNWATVMLHKPIMRTQLVK